MFNRKGLTSVVINAKGGEIISSLFVWRIDRPLMVVSYCPKKGNNILLLTTPHEDLDICPEARKDEKPFVINFYNAQRCGVNIINEMIKMIKCLSMQLSLNHLLEKAKVTSLQKQARDATTTILQYNEATKEAIESDPFVCYFVCIPLCYRYNFQTISINSESVTQLVG